jgi:hypothetical protein
MIDITIEKMKNDHTDVDVLEQLQKQLEQYIKYKKIENKITETNSFVIGNITNYKSLNDIDISSKVCLKLMNVQIMDIVEPNDVHIIRKDTEFVVQIDNIQLTPQQQTGMVELMQ